MSIELTDEEREALHGAVRSWFDGVGHSDLKAHIHPAVEAIIAARLAEQREAIAAAIEALPDVTNESDPGWFRRSPIALYWLGVERAACIVREWQPGDEH